MLFDVFLASQAEAGTLVEVGAYLGRSAVIVGDHLKDGERFVVVDLFGSVTELDESSANERENRTSYSTLTREQFEANYLALHDALPEVVQDLSSAVVDHVKPNEARFVHVDASHLYDQVSVDVRNAKTILRSDGVVVFDDFRKEHTPGVAAAVWDAVVNGGLHPIAITPRKFYGTWGDSEPYRRVVHDLSASRDSFRVSTDEVAGYPFLRVKPAAAPPAAPRPPLSVSDIDRIAQRLATHLANSAQTEAAAVAHEGHYWTTTPPNLTGRRRAARFVARNVAPPALTQWFVRRRGRTRG